MQSSSHISLEQVSEGSHDETCNNRLVIRTPSPTPSEHAALTDYGKSQRAALFKKQNIKYVLTIVVILTLIILLLVFKDDLVEFLEPAARWMHDTPAGWLIPIAGLIVLSFPPLLGHEVILILSGFTWGMGIGFGISAAGVFIGEIIVFYVFKYFFRARSERMEAESISYAVLARVLRDGGLRVAIVARWSAIPPHLLTGILAIIGMDIWTFCIAAFLALPRQAVLVFVGYAMRSEGNPKDQTIKNAIEYSALAVKILITIFAAYYMRKQEQRMLPDVIYERRKRRQARGQDLADKELRTAEEGNMYPLAPIPVRGHASKPSAEALLISESAPIPVGLSTHNSD